MKMTVNHLSENNSLLNQFLKEIRSVDIQHDSMRFRRNIERIGEVMAYEISKSLAYETEQVKTPLGIAPTKKAGGQRIEQNGGDAVHAQRAQACRKLPDAGVACAKPHVEPGIYGAPIIQLIRPYGHAGQCAVPLQQRCQQEQPKGG